VTSYLLPSSFTSLTEYFWILTIENHLLSNNFEYKRPFFQAHFPVLKITKGDWAEKMAKERFFAKQKRSRKLFSAEGGARSKILKKMSLTIKKPGLIAWHF